MRGVRADNGEQLSVLQTGHFDEVANAFFGDDAVLGTVTLEISLLEHGSVVAFFFGHLPEELRNLERLGVLEFREKFGELRVDFGVALFDEDGNVERFLRRERCEFTFHVVERPWNRNDVRPSRPLARWYLRAGGSFGGG